MDLNDLYTRLNFYINKAQGGWYSPEELTEMVDTAQHILFNSYYDKYATSQRLNDALAPFKTDYQFTLVATPDGLITPPANYRRLLALYTVVTGADNVTRKRPVEIINEEELAIRLNSQVVPVTVNDPIAVLKSDWNIQLYPDDPAAGVLTYLRQPVKPFYDYSVVSGRVIVYDQAGSTQLEWSDNDCQMIIQLALNGLGINLSEADILQYSEQKIQQNFNTNMRQ